MYIVYSSPCFVSLLFRDTPIDTQGPAFDYGRGTIEISNRRDNLPPVFYVSSYRDMCGDPERILFIP